MAITLWSVTYPAEEDLKNSIVIFGDREED